MYHKIRLNLRLNKKISNRCENLLKKKPEKYSSLSQLGRAALIKLLISEGMWPHVEKEEINKPLVKNKNG